MKVSTRINGRVTSINIRNTVCALHYIICGDPVKDAEEHVLDFCHDCMSDWEGLDGRGASGFITDKMLEDMLEAQDVPEYKRTLERLGG